MSTFPQSLPEGGMLVQNIYYDCEDCGHRQRMFSASPGYVITAKGTCPRCSNTFTVRPGLVTPFSVELLSLAEPASPSSIFADQIRYRLTKFLDDADVRKLSALLPDDGERVVVRQAAMATLLWLIKDKGPGEFRAPQTVEVHYVNANSAHERAAVLQQIIEKWAPADQLAE